MNNYKENMVPRGAIIIEQNLIIKRNKENETDNTKNHIKIQKKE